MKYTKEEIEQIKNDPFVQILAKLVGDSSAIDEAIKFAEKEISEKESLEKEEKEECTVFDDDELKVLAQSLCNITNQLDSYENVGLYLRNTDLWMEVVNVLGILLEEVFDTKTANIILSEDINNCAELVSIIKASCNE